MDHTITIATRQAPIDTLEPPTMGTLYRWECSCKESGLTWRSTWEAAWSAGGRHKLCAENRPIWTPQYDR